MQLMRMPTLAVDHSLTHNPVGACPRIEAVARESYFELDYLII